MGTNSNTFDYKFKLLQDYIKETYSVESYSNLFNSLQHHHEKVCMAFCLLDEAKLLPENATVNSKSSKKSTCFREKGNKEFLKKKDLLAIQTYSVSVAFAPNNSEELSLAFANRSAVTFSLKEYEFCVNDIDRALNGKYPEHLKYKLYERKGKCLKFLGMIKSAKDVFQLALDSLNKSHLDEEKVNVIKLSLTKELENCLKDKKNKKIDKKCLPCLSQSRNDVILAASSLLKMEFTPELGRHLVSTADIEPGDVLVIEEPFASVLLPASYNNHCFHCKSRCHGLIPCLYCVAAMYCSETCRSASWEESHRIECVLVPLFMDLELTKIELISLRTVLIATKQNKSLQEVLDTIPLLESTADPKLRGLNDQGLYESRDYRSVHHLVGNMELRSNADIFRRAATAAYILHLLDKFTDYFSSASSLKVPEQISISNTFQSLPLSLEKLVVGGLLFRYLMIVPSNAHEVSEMEVTKTSGDVFCESIEIGGALYPVLSLINHSCDPNVVRHSHIGDINVLTAIQVIHAGEQILDNYGYHHAMHDLATRQSKLLSQYHFKCQCRACVEDWPLYSQLPSDNPIFLNPSLKDEVDRSSNIFQEVLVEIRSGDMDKKLPFLYAHLSLLHKTIQRPWKEYSECQEAIKQCLSLQANHYICC